jgi:DNA-binding transcriptional MerR regulator
MPDTDGLLAIGDLARRTATATSTLRYYDRIGLLPSAERSSGRRRFVASSAERLALIRLCQDAGFTLTEIRQLLGATSRRSSWTHLAQRKIGELDARIAEARQAKKLLEHALDCSHRDVLTCPQFRAALHARQQESKPPAKPVKT